MTSRTHWLRGPRLHHPHLQLPRPGRPAWPRAASLRNLLLVTIAAGLALFVLEQSLHGRRASRGRAAAAAPSCSTALPVGWAGAKGIEVPGASAGFAGRRPWAGDEPSPGIVVPPADPDSRSSV